ncbi:MAG: hypothetical protein ACKO96_48990, partial [Flammeovirgaceae bacterium]
TDGYTGISKMPLSPNISEILFLRSAPSFFQKSHISLPGLLACVGDKILRINKHQIEAKYKKLGADLKNRISEMLGDSGILLMPVYPSVAPKHDKMVLRPMNWNYTSWLNSLGFPCTVAPIKLVQVILSRIGCHSYSALIL